MVFLYSLVGWLIALGALAYIATIIYSLFAKVTGRHKLPHLLLIITLPPLLLLTALAVLLFPLSNAASQERYAQWTEKCGHTPVVGVKDWFEPTHTAEIGNSAKDYMDMAGGYFCTFSEAYSQGYSPPGTGLKQGLQEAGYSPSQEDIALFRQQGLKQGIDF